MFYDTLFMIHFVVVSSHLALWISAAGSRKGIASEKYVSF